MGKLIHVAVGVIKNSQGQILIAKRADDAHQGGLWEFPGGKVEVGETLQQALVRELNEELAIEVTSCKPLIQIRHDYPDKSVLLDVCIVDDFVGEALGNEGQPIRWVESADLQRYEFPAANRVIVRAIQLPPVMMITGAENNLDVFTEKLSTALASGVRLVQLRQPQLNQTQQNESEWLSYFQVTKALTEQAGARLQINSGHSCVESSESGVGLHLSSTRLMALKSRPVPLDICFGASCHNLLELRQAEAVQADYVVLSPVLATQSHPEAEVLDWDKFAVLVADAKMPVYALGGMSADFVKKAQSCGAQGVAGISSWWP